MLLPFGVVSIVLVVVCALSACSLSSSITQKKLEKSGPKVLCVVAHPDDVTEMCVLLYLITHNTQPGQVHLVILTNGEGGYRYSTLAKHIYNLPLDQEKSARTYLPDIREKEERAAGKIIGVSKYYFLKQKDDSFSTEVEPYLKPGIWDVAYIQSQLKQILSKESYDYVFMLLPTEDAHAHHKAAATLTLNTIAEFPERERPTALAICSPQKGKQLIFGELATTLVSTNKPFVEFDRTTKFGCDNKLDYRIIVAWVITEHKSQGMLAMSLWNGKDIEQVYLCKINSPDRILPTQNFFEALGGKLPER